MRFCDPLPKNLQVTGIRPKVSFVGSFGKASELEFVTNRSDGSWMVRPTEDAEVQDRGEVNLRMTLSGP